MNDYLKKINVGDGMTDQNVESFRQTQNGLLFAFDDGVIDEEEFLFLFDLSTSKNLDYPYWEYQAFDLDWLSDDKCRIYFRFFKSDINWLIENLQIPEEITSYNVSIFNGLEAFCALLKPFLYPCRYADIIPVFGRSVPELLLISNHMLDFMYNTHRHLLQDFNQTWLSLQHLEQYAVAISNKGSALEHCWDFIYGKIRPVCCPGSNQRVLNNGNKQVHAIKFQSIAAPNGMITNL